MLSQPSWNLAEPATWSSAVIWLQCYLSLRHGKNFNQVVFQAAYTCGEVKGTESIATIRSPFCGYNTAQAKGRRFILLLKQRSIRWFMKMSVWSLACQQRVFQRYHSGRHFSRVLPTRWRRKPASVKITSLSLYVLHRRRLFFFLPRAKDELPPSPFPPLPSL